MRECGPLNLNDLDDDVLSECLRHVGPSLRAVNKRFKACWDRSATEITLHAKHLPEQYEETGSDALRVMTQGPSLHQHACDPLLRILNTRLSTLPTSSMPSLQSVALDGPLTDAQLAAVVLPNAHRIRRICVSRAEQITGAGVRVLAQCSLLEDLTVRSPGPSVNDRDLGALAACPRLRSLTLKRAACVTGTFIPALQGLTALALLDCPLVDEAHLAALSSLPMLEKIEVAHVPNTAVMVDDDLMLLDDRPGVPDLTDLSLSRIAAAPCLREICLSDAVVTDAGLVALASSCQSLERVTLDGCPHVNDPGVCALSRLPRLKAVSLSDCGSLSDRTAEALGGAACLTELSMTPCAGLSDRGLAALGGSRSLRSVSLMFMEGVTDGGVEALCRGGLLTCLVLRHNHAACLTGKSVAAIARCRGLRDLRIGFLSALSGCDLGPLASCHRLRSVDATLCSGLGDAMASLLALPELSRLSLTSSLPPFARPADDAVARCRAPEPASASLQFVAVPHNAGVDDAWLAQLAERCRDLETLDVSGCAHVSDKGIKQVLLKCQSLRVLRLTECSGITGRFMRHLHRVPNIRIITLSSCHSLEASSVGTLAQCPKLQFVDLGGIVCHNAEDEIELDALLGQVRASCLRLTHIRAPAPRFLVHLRTATG